MNKLIFRYNSDDNFGEHYLITIFEMNFNTLIVLSMRFQKKIN